MTPLLAALLLASPLTEEQEQVKHAIERFQDKIERATPNEIALLKGKLAILLYRDQEQEKAFHIFLEALEEASPNQQLEPSREELQLYEEALHLYLEHGLASAHSTASQILQKYGPVLSQNDEYHLLRFIIAAACANQGNFEEFFDHFFTSYQLYPHHYIAHKTKSVLHIKLFERARTLQDREDQREKVISHVSEALERYPNDHALYKLIIAFSRDEDKPTRVRTYLNKIVENNIVIPRSEISFYVQQCVETEQKDVGMRFIKKTHEWYQYSRAVQAAEKLLGEE
ncbi:MAG: hypothetical protein K940chlam7_01791 [Chlamydiae bacterium]|nr:hypothetical protein [Chlamydiota bacterium]